MTTIKTKFKPSDSSEAEGRICYKIIHERRCRQILTPYRIYASEWDEKSSTIKIATKNERTPYLNIIRNKIHKDLDRLRMVVHRLAEKRIIFSAEDIVIEYKIYLSDLSLFNFMEKVVTSLRENGKMRTSETYAITLSNFKKFRGHEDIMLDNLTSEIMESYESWQRQRGIVPNTISFYFRILRAVYNRAVEKGIVDNRNPFRRVYTGIDKTVKRALPLRMVSKIRGLDLSSFPSLDFARDMFMLSFMLRGMSFIDMAYLKKRDLRDGYIIYRRRKTGQLLYIAWTKDMQNIVDKYPVNKSDYLLPIFRESDINERDTYRNVAYNINHNLKKIGNMIGFGLPLTLYVARHSWASAAKAKGIPVSIISEGMGHNSETTTRIYLASLDTTVVDKANSLILKSL